MKQNRSLIRDISKKNHEIISFLADFKEQDSSIYGLFGINLALINYGLHTSEKHILDIGLKNVQDTLLAYDIMPNKYHSYSTGLVSLGVMVNYLSIKELVEVESYFFNIVDNIAFSYGNTFIDSSNFDFIGGSTGIGFYFENRFKESKLAYSFLDKWIEEINKRISDEKIHIFDTHLSSESNQIINLGLAHGLPSILKLVLKLTKKIPEDRRVFNILQSIVTFFKKSVIQSNSLYFYPHTFESGKFFNKKTVTNRLAWCYGDLSLGYILFQASILLNDRELHVLSIKILETTTNRRLQSSTGVIDAGLCHGTSGIAHIYNRIFNYTKKEIYIEASEFWLQQSFTYFTDGNGTLGYSIPDNKDKINEVEMLNGIAGISLAFQSYIFSTYDWDFCLLLDEV